MISCLIHVLCCLNHPSLPRYSPEGGFLAPVSLFAEFLLLLLLTCIGKHALTVDYLIFLFLFLLSPPVHVSALTHANPFSPVRSSPCIFFCFFAKHDVRGNFPDHKGTKPCPAHGFMSLLALFLCPPVSRHPIAHIQTHPHPFTPICTPPYPKFLRCRVPVCFSIVHACQNMSCAPIPDSFCLVFSLPP